MKTHIASVIDFHFNFTEPTLAQGLDREGPMERQYQKHDHCSQR
jgi:hypothetical protein